MLYFASHPEQKYYLLAALEFFVEGYVKDNSDLVKHISIDTSAVDVLISAINEETDFPYINGKENASAFKKAAYLVTYIMSMQLIKGVEYENEIDNSYQFSHPLKTYDPNAVFAVSLAITLLNDHQIHRSDGTVLSGFNQLALTEHSYLDLLEALTSITISPSQHYKLIALLLEQIFYKTNPHCQYPSFFCGPQDYIDPIVEANRTTLALTQYSEQD